MSEDPKSNVVSLHTGVAIVPPHTPIPALVERLEWLLERAQAGEIQGFAGAWFWSDESIGCGFRGKISYSMVGRLEQIQHDIIEALRD